MIKIAILNEKAISALLVICVLSEIFLLNQNFALKKEVSSYHLLKELLNQYQAREEINVLIRAIEGKSVPFFSHLQQHSRANKNLKARVSRFAVIFCFSMDDCGSCLANESSIWNKFHKTFDSKACQVIGVTDTTGFGNLKSIARYLNIRFPLAHVSDMKNQLNEHGITLTPIAFFFDLTMNRIIYAHASLPYSESSSEDFVKKLQLMFDECE